MTDPSYAPRKWWFHHAKDLQAHARKSLEEPLDRVFGSSTVVDPQSAPPGLGIEFARDSPPPPQDPAPDAVTRWTLAVEPIHEWQASFSVPATSFHGEKDPKIAVMNYISTSAARVADHVRAYLLSVLAPTEVCIASGNLSKAVAKAVEADVGAVGFWQSKVASSDEKAIELVGETALTAGVETVLVPKLYGALLVRAVDDAPRLVRVSVPPIVIAATNDGLTAYVRARLVAWSADTKVVHYRWADDGGP